MENHQCINIGQRIDLCRQGALFSLGRPHAAPVVNRLFKFGERQVHTAILPALGSEAEPELIRERDDERRTQVAEEGQSRQASNDQAQQAEA